MRLALLILAVVMAVRFLKRLGRGPLIPRGATGKPRLPRLPQPKVLAFKRRPHDVLGVKEDASDEAFRGAYLELLARNDPSKVTDMSDEVKDKVAQVRTEVEEAWTQVCKEREID
jgi:DnaJ-domain-containing protein 1